MNTYTYQSRLIFEILKSFLKKFMRMVYKILLSQEGKSAHVEPALGKDVSPGSGHMMSPDVGVRGRDHDEPIYKFRVSLRELPSQASTKPVTDEDYLTPLT